MNKLFCVIFCSVYVFSLSVWAQQEQKIVSYEGQKVGLELGVKQNFPAILDFRIDKEGETSIDIKNIAFKNGDIVLTYNLPSNKIVEHYEVKLYVRSDETPWQSLTLKEAYGRVQHLNKDTPMSRDFVWTNPVDKIIPFEGFYEILLDIEGMATLPKNLNCTDGEPQWGLKEKLPHMMISSMGAAAVIWSIPIEREANRLYNEYLQETSEETANPILDNANTRRHRFLIFRNGGFSLVALGAITYFIWRSRHKKKLNNFELYCRDLEVSPALDLVGPQKGGGIQLKYNF